MIEVIRHYVVVLVGMTLTGLICAAALPFAHSPRGGVGPTFFQAESPITTTIATGIALVAAFAVSAVVGRLINACVGLFVMGWGIAVFAMRTETVQEVALSGDTNLMLVVIETIFWGALILVMTVLMFKVTGPLKDIRPRQYEEPPDPFRSRDALKLIMPAVLVLPGVMLIAQSPMKGQVLCAVFVGSVAGGLMARLVAPHVQPILLFAMPCLFGALGHVIGMILLQGPIDEAFVTHAIPALSLPAPVDYAAGSLMGVAFGLGWAKSFLHHEDEKAEPSSVTTSADA